MNKDTATDNIKLKTLKKYTLLCVEDDLEVLSELSSFFSRYFAKVYTAPSAEDGWEQFCKYAQDVVFSDIVMEKMSGVELIRRIKQTSPKTIAVFLSAKTDSYTLIETIGLKPLDFIPKPIMFSKLIGLMSRISDELSSDSVSIGSDTEINFKAMQIKANGETSDITAKEARMLRLLTDNHGHTVSYETIQKVVWNDEEMSDSSLKSLLYRIRSKIGKEKIKTLSGVGIRLEI